MGRGTRVKRWAIASMAMLAACSSSSSPLGSVTTSNECADGFAPASDGDGCTEILPTNDCAPGTRAALGSTTCTKVAAFACPVGFAPDASGWGCRDISPANDCPPGTIEELGSTTCAPIDDCNAPFPPANATRFVDDDTITPDATHFKTIGDAIIGAPPGTVIAVEAGLYFEGVEPHLSMSIVGRCASKVLVTAPSPTTMLAGFQANDVSDGPVSVSGMSFTGFRGGIVEQASDLTVTDVDIHDSMQSGIVAIGGQLHVVHTRSAGAIANGELGYGAFVSDGANALFERVVLAKNPVSGLAVNSKSTAKISQSIVRDSTSDASGQGGTGVAIAEGSTGTVDTCAIIANHSSSVEGYDLGTVVNITNSVLRDALANPAGGEGDGIALDTQAIGNIQNTTVTGNAEDALVAIAAGTTAHVSSSVFVGYGDDPQAGIALSNGAHADLTDVAVVGTRDFGLLAEDNGSAFTAVNGTLVGDVTRTKKSDDVAGNGVEISYGAALTMNDSTVFNAMQLGIGIGGTDATGSGGTVTLTKVLVAHTIATEKGTFGRGIQVTNGATLTATGLALLDNQELGLCLGLGGTASLTQSLARGTGSIGPTTFGYGIIVLADSSITVESSAVRENLVGFAFSESCGSIDNTVVAHNGIGIFAEFSTLNDVSAPPADLTPRQVFVSQTRFDDNATRVSSADIPLPDVIP